MTEETNEVATTSREAPRPAETGDAERSPDGQVAAPARRRRSRGRGRGRGRPTQAGQAPSDEGGSTGGTDASPDGAAKVADAVQGTAETPPKTQRAPRTRTTKAAPEGGKKEPASAPKGEPKEAAGEAEAAEAGSTPAAKRRRRRRGGRGRSRSTRPAGSADAGTDEASASLVADATEAPADVVETPDATAPTRTATRRRRRPAASDASKEKASEPEAPAPEAEQQPAPTRRRRAASPATRTKASDASEPAAQKTAAEDSSRPTRTRRARLPGRRRREPQPVIARNGDKTMLITELGERDQIAVLEDRTLVEHYITRSGAKSMVGNIYLGKVQNVLPGMEAAFIDVGRGRNAVLYAGEVSYDEEIDGDSPRIEHVLKAGQNVLVQVTKDPMGGKGARLTQEISLPGRYLVFVPNSQVFGISRRLPDKERQRLKDLLKQVRPPEHGVIVRTAAEGASEEDLRRDLERLVEEWGVIDKSRKRGKAPRVLYEEPELTVRVVRDMFNEGEFKEIVTDSERLYRDVTTYLRAVAPELESKVRMHTGPLPVLEAFHAIEQIHKALDRKVWLPSGGYIVVDKTEAMTVIDVNTGKHVGKANLEETVTKTNVEAADEVARQLRLRDIGGIIIIDFIDMLFERNKEKVISTLKNALAQDKTRSQVFDIGPLGLLEVTRKRVSAGLLESFSETCPTCEGRGILLTHKL